MKIRFIPFLILPLVVACGIVSGREPESAADNPAAPVSDSQNISGAASLPVVVSTSNGFTSQQPAVHINDTQIISSTDSFSNQVSTPAEVLPLQPTVSESTATATKPEEQPYEIQRSCHGRVCIVKYSNGHWRLLVDGRPFFIHGMEYSPDRVGVRPKNPNEWMESDINHNGKIDGPYDSFIDANKNNIRDPDEKVVGDFKLLNEMGCNVIRIYHPTGVNKQLLRDLYRNYGIYVIMGNFIGAYAVGSGAEWKAGTNYADRKQRKHMFEELKKMVNDFKDEPYVLMWMLGNENDVIGNYENSTYNNTNASVNPEAYASFIGEACRMIKSIDKDHPVAVCNGSMKMIPYYKKFAQEIDIIGMNSYAGPFGFGTLWNRIKYYFDRPVLITEYGCDAYNLKKREEDEDFQALYHKRAWKDIEKNSFGGPGAGNSLGGVIFCWLDKWWLCGAPERSRHRYWGLARPD